MTRESRARREDVRLDRRTAWVAAGVSGLVLIVAAAVLVPWDWLPGAELRPVDATDVFSAEELARAEDHASVVRPLGLASTALSLLVLGALALTPWGRRLATAVARRLPWWLAAPVVVLVALTAARLATTPLAYLVRRRNLEAGLTDQPTGAWLVDRALGLGVSVVTTSLLVLLVVATARRFPRRWFLPAGALAAALVMGGSFAYPLLVEPLFNRFTPVPDGPFRTAALELAEREGVEVEDVLVADASRRTTTLNAYVSGLGGTRRIVVYDNLLDGVPLDQAMSVVAHELAHVRHQDVLVGTTLGAAGAVLAVCALALLLDTGAVRSRAGPAGGPAVAGVLVAVLAVGTFLSGPVENVVSRAIEARADRTALVATGDPDAFEAVQRQLSIRSLADPTPPEWARIWFSSHPTVLQRLGLAEAFREGRGEWG
ncbi:M48 family metallopeptidase [Nocardioides caldifontis]|uniref:M48 family metallopeptidase n=1 Tax=Nocardioides caldifontis TaxID=2588938 RepID=UPI001396B0DE|nr:M48 family metallopeptidase [Nocardioides caldifontis]